MVACFDDAVALSLPWSVRLSVIYRLIDFYILILWKLLVVITYSDTLKAWSLFSLVLMEREKNRSLIITTHYPFA